MECIWEIRNAPVLLENPTKNITLRTMRISEGNVEVKLGEKYFKGMTLVNNVWKENSCGNVL
jgi:GH43 family beta-xylosidase